MMSIPFTLLVITVCIALAFDLVNGFHDSANSIATVVSTRVLSPLQAVIWAAFFNFIAILVFAPKVADTVAQIVRIQAHDINYVYVIFTALIAAIVWNLFTWLLGLPTSSSHALIGGLAGAGMSFAGWQALRWEILLDTMAFIVLAPLLGFLLGALLMSLLYVLFRSWSPAKVRNLFAHGQLFSAALYSIGHGANDAQKTMGVIVALLIASGHLPVDVSLSLANRDTLWIILSCQLAMALGTALGGWRIVKTMGMKIVKLRPPGGFCAETSGALTLFFATHLGIPVSTTHTITGAIMGVGTISTHLSRIKWGVAANVIWAWVLTIPASALLAGFLFRLVVFLKEPIPL